ncbi:MAG: C69 family dipeptidase [Prolixibacteraceae bacterium]
MKKFRIIIVLIFSIIQFNQADACTNFLITKGATVNGTPMITYAADSHTLYGELYFWPAANYKAGTMVDVYEWDTGKLMGKIPQAPHTYQVVGNINEHQLSIGETTFGGRKELATQTGAIVDYGSLIYMTLQRAKNAREAIGVMTNLVKDFGYASSGESFSIADAEEVWILEMISKGNGQKGALWVAMKIPDGYISGHANQARITQFPLDKPGECLYSPDVISFAREKGWFSGTNNEFSFSDTYAPVEFGGARFCDARVWAGFNQVNKQMGKYEDYAMGKITYDKNHYATNRMPLWIKPDAPLSLENVISMMRDHYEGTALDMTKDPGAGPFQLPYRWRPMTWNVDSVAYCHERAISTQQTGFSFVTQSRSNLPDPIGGIIWFGVDDTYSTCYMPVYCGISEVPNSLKVGNGDFLNWSETSAFWTFNTVSNFCYLRYNDMIKDVQKVQSRKEKEFMSGINSIDQQALEFWKKGDKANAIKTLTAYSVSQVETTVKDWNKLFHYLMIKYKDGNVMKEKDGKFEWNEFGKQPEQPLHPAYPDSYYKMIIEKNKEHFKAAGE